MSFQSFRRYGGLNYAANNNIVSSNVSNANILTVANQIGLTSTETVVQTTLDCSANLNVSGTTTLWNTTDNNNANYKSGALIVHGGVGIAKSVYVGGNIYWKNNTTQSTALPSGTNWGDYIYWDSNTEGWAVGDTNIKLGQNAGRTGQGANAIAIGQNAGRTSQGANAIAIGYNAGATGQKENSIVLNATSDTINGDRDNATYIHPIRDTGTDEPLPAAYLTYNTGTFEVGYNTAKPFIIDHPLDPEKYLVHTCLEGPEAGVYYRGEGILDPSGETSIQLPAYVDRLAKDFTVQLTPIQDDDPNIKHTPLSCSKVKHGAFKVYGQPRAEFFWLVHGNRFAIDVEPDKKSVDVRGDGPYKYIENQAGKKLN